MPTAAETAKEAAKETLKIADQRQAAGEQIATAGVKAFRDTVERSLAGLNQLNSHSKQNIEALMASATATAKGAETLGAQALAFSKTAMERQVEAAKALSSARSVQEIIELQTSFAKSALETYMAEVNRAQETMSQAVKGALRPLNERATAMVETFQSLR